MLRLATDADVSGAIIRGLFLRITGIDLLRSQDYLKEGTPDPEVLSWAAAQQRVLITNDRKTMINFARRRANSGNPGPGVIATTNNQSIGAAIDDIILVRASFTSSAL